MKRLLLVVSLLFFSFSCLAAEDVVHLVHSGNTVYEKLTKLSMQNTLVNSAKEYEKYGQVARATNYDMAYPIDSSEYSKMNGFGVLWVTSHSQVKEELPIKNLRISIENLGTIGLEPIYSFSTEEQDELVAKVLGKHRSDVIYMIPFFEEVRGATLIADYSENRNDFVLGNIEDDFPQEIGKLIKLPAVIKYPDKELFNAMLEREYPIAKELITKSEVSNKLLKPVRFVRQKP